METFIKATAGILIALILCLILSKQGKDLSILLALAVCCMVLTAALTYLQPVLDFFDRLTAIGKLDTDLIGILLKAVGIGLLAEIAGLICADAGNSAMGKVLQIMAAALILALSVPIFTQLLELIETILVAQ